MQPKAAKKIGGMTPKKMTGGTYGAEEEIKGSYKITKQIDEENGMMKICVESEMPGAKLKEEEDKDGEEGREEEDGSAVPPPVEVGGKKKRKSSKKRKSMKKKGGMKRKSMKVKA